jgi:hypothetical protein
MATHVNAALLSAKKHVKPSAEWLSTESDLQVLALLAHYHAQKQLAAYHLELFDRTRDDSCLLDATQELKEGLAIWRKLVSLTDGVYPAAMSFGPDDKGDWKDKLPYVEYDLQIANERAAIYQQFGKFTMGFDFGGPVKQQANPNDYRTDNYVLQNNAEPGFLPVDPSMLYNDERGYGWLGSERREAVAVSLTPYREVRAVSNHPEQLPHDVLFRDYIGGSGLQRFAVKVNSPGEYKVLSSIPITLPRSKTNSRRARPAAASAICSRSSGQRKTRPGSNVGPDHSRQITCPASAPILPASQSVG